MIISAEEFYRLRTSDDPIEYRRSMHDTATDEVWFEVIYNHPEMRKWVALNKYVSYNVLELLSRDENSIVREAVARKKSAGGIILARLASDPDDSVRLAVAYNDKTPKDVLLTLLQDPWDQVVEVATEMIKNRT